MPRTASRPALNYRTEGRGHALVLSHPLGCTLRMWDDLAARLSERYRVTRYDTRCHGQSEVVADPFSLDDMVNDVVRLLDELRCDVVSFVGLSMGGMIGQGLAIAQPRRVNKMVLANTTSRYSDEARGLWAERARIARTEGMRGLVDLIMTRYFSPGFLAARSEDVARFSRDVLGVNADGYAACCAAIESLDYYSRLGEIACPTLVIAGGADVAAPPSSSEEIAHRVPHARLAVIPDAGHLSAVERPAAFLALVTDFLDFPT